MEKNDFEYEAACQDLLVYGSSLMLIKSDGCIKRIPPEEWSDLLKEVPEDGEE